MKAQAVLLFTAWLIPQCPLAAQTPTVDAILAEVQNNAGQFVRSLPDFVCDEKVTSRGLHRGKVLEVVIESQFVGLQKRSGRMSYSETREIRTVDGNPARTGQKFTGPFLFGGGFSSLLDETFSPKYVSSHTYKIAGEEALNGTPAFVLEFATKEAQKELYFLLYGKAVLQKDVGKAWIDKTSLRVLRLERHHLNVQKGQTPMVATVDYGEVRIDGKPFWMPTSVKAEQSFKGGELGQYLATYTNYRKFEVSSGIVFDEK
jgi:hypothetical protein